MKIKKCRKCSGMDFVILETLCHEAELSPDTEDLTVYKERTCGIEKIFCKNCEEEYLKKNFELINFR